MVATATLPEDMPSFRAQEEGLPHMDGFRSTRVSLRLSGLGELDPLSGDDTRLLEAARLGRELRLIVTCEVSQKGFRLDRKADREELHYVATAKVLEIEAAETV